MKNKQLFKHPTFIWSALSVLLLVAVPWLAITLVPAYSGMAVCILLFFAVDPVFAIAAGMAAGKRPKQLWFLPFLIPVLFVAGTWLCLDPGEQAFLNYALLYFLLSAVTMLIFVLVLNKRGD